MADGYDGDWSEETTVMRPMDNPTYKMVMDLPDGAEVMFLVTGFDPETMQIGSDYNCIQMTPEARADMQARLDEAGPEFAKDPDNVMAAEFVMWIHPDDMSESKRAAIAILLAQQIANGER